MFHVEYVTADTNPQARTRIGDIPASLALDEQQRR